MGATSAPLLDKVSPDPIVQGAFTGSKPTKPAKDLSGIACRPTGSAAALDCLVINDEGTFAQRVAINSRTLRPDPAVVPLVGNSIPSAAVGTPPNVSTCPKGVGKFDEFDGEGVAYAPSVANAQEGAFFVVGSHGCARHKDKFQLSSFLVARVPVSGNGIFGPVALTWRLSGALRTAPAIGDFFGRSLESAQGLNIEGIAAAGDDLYVGLRAPSLPGGDTAVIRVSVTGLFAPGTADAALGTKVYRAPLGRDTGIRDMTILPDGRLLLLSGPAQEQANVPFAIAVMTINGPKPTISWLGRLRDVSDEDGKRAKAEAITVLRREQNTLQLLVLYDGIKNGGPQEYRIQLPN